MQKEFATRFNPDISELMTDEQAEALVGRILSGQNVAQALREIIEWLGECCEDVRETNADTLEEALSSLLARLPMKARGKRATLQPA